MSSLFNLRMIRYKLISPVLQKLDKIQDEIEKNRMLIVQSRIREFCKIGKLPILADSEFKVFSQWGEDGIIQYLISKVQITNKVFVEFGVEDYLESNTRFLLMNNNWSGLIIEANGDAISKIRSSKLYRLYNLQTACAFIKKNNINSLISGAGINGDIGILSIDIDGNDYWIWEAISEDVICPRIVIIEYNSIFGKEHPITIPYDDNIVRVKAHDSNLFYGASIKALCTLAYKKGYVFVGSNSAGNNAFFVRKDMSSKLLEVDCETGYIESKFRESLDKSGKLSYISGKNRIKVIENEVVFDTEREELFRIKELGTR